MFKVKWDSDNNGVILSEYIEENDALNSPRPVYAEELRMLGLEKSFDLPSDNVPVCWEIDRKYYYCGEVIAETSKGNIYEDPAVKVKEGCEGKRLEPIDITTLISKNEKMLKDIEEGRTGIIDMEIDGVPSRVFYGSIENLEWTLAIVAPISDLNKPFLYIGLALALLALIGIIIVFIICRRIDHA